MYEQCVMTIGGQEVCRGHITVPAVADEITIEDSLLGEGHRYTVVRVHRVLGTQLAHTSIEARLLSGGPFVVTTKTVYVDLAPVVDG